jgi:regulator of PEP synthase PpsR (kinase-PPPase family)
VFVVSDGSGRTCEHAVKAALVQFEGQEVKLVLKSNVRTARQVTDIAEDAANHKAAVIYTLVAGTPRKAMAEAAAKAAFPAIDLLRPVLDTLSSLLHATPKGKPGLYYESQKEYFDRLEAVEYTLHHDDGQRPDELRKANVVLVGLSRVSKSATCFVLAYNGIRAANVPIVPGCALPAELLRLDPHRVIGLTMNANRLEKVREIRMERMRMGEVATYTDRRQILREIHEADSLMTRHGWRTIDASYRSIEDTAQEVMRLLPNGRD